MPTRNHEGGGGPPVTKCLYYPYIHFHSLEWLKTALLYWEGVKRIVPYRRFETQDPPEVRELVADGLVEDVPAQEYREQAAEMFMPRLEALTRSRGGAIAGTARRMADRAREQAADEEARVHAVKMDQRLIGRLMESGLARQAGDWFLMAQEVAGLYMMVLAGEASRHLNAPMATDAYDYEVSSLYFNTEGGTTTPAGDSVALVRVLCPFPRPSNVRLIPLERIRRIHEQYREERRQFRQEIEKLSRELAKSPSQEALKDAIEDRKRQIEEALKRQKRVLDEAKVDSYWSLLSISVPGAVTGGAALAGLAGPIVSVLGATAIGVGLVNWYGKRRSSLRKAAEACPWHYLISLDRELSVADAQNSFEAAMSQLIYD